MENKWILSKKSSECLPIYDVVFVTHMVEFMNCFVFRKPTHTEQCKK